MGHHNEYRLSLQIQASLYHSVYRYASSDAFEKQRWSICFCQFSHVVLFCFHHATCFDVNIQPLMAETSSIQTGIKHHSSLSSLFPFFFPCKNLNITKILSHWTEKYFLQVKLFLESGIFYIFGSSTKLEDFYLLEQKWAVKYCILSLKSWKSVEKLRVWEGYWFLVVPAHVLCLGIIIHRLAK